MPGPHVTAVIVAYNRAGLLAEALDALRDQTVRPDRVIVVDNASTDGSDEVAADRLELWGDAGRLIPLTENTGGAGGFAVGIAAALLPDSDGKNSDWIWVMDDDTVPDPTALQSALNEYREFCKHGRDSVAVMGSRVEWIDGSQHPMNTPKQKFGATAAEIKRADAAGVVAIRSISFVSAFLRVSRVRQLGLPIADYFLWNDDFEYTARLAKGARAIFLPGSLVTHKTAKRGSSDSDPGERFYFEVRNKLWLFRYSRALYLWEKLAYFVASLRRWARTLKASSQRGVLLRCLARGVRDAALTRPRDNAEVLLTAGVPDDVMRVILRGAEV